ncbi:ATPase [Gordonia pseudamarae]|uniref:histidine kinase n=1 Tax=Gordonia pseudamarae TaxID=2831662 RepID=A0ABX6IM75_9ACTN|nr:MULTISPECIES: PAS domain-containing sensor histidine kinase [Gordonia]MBD0022730.1 histidine kinase N-terminal domain-containing protein [Gordonia sp. (in: high G+C Gram-positive bacteria)]QHN27338.1 ATPase [Gordonia pseudamarae]QHN36221.1 ATPase [Gordonia pseudamarae]
MSTLVDLLAEHTTLSDAAAGHLQRLVAEWQLLADLSFADLMLTVRGDTGAMVTVAQCRPNTASTVFPADEVGRILAPGADDQVARAFADGRIHRDEDPTWHGAVAIRREVIPVANPLTPPEAGTDPAILGVLIRATDLTHPRLPSPLEMAYQESAHDLCQMVADGTFPEQEGNSQGLSTPRAGDGFIRLDPAGVVSYASPNALSAFHRMGWTSELANRRLTEVAADLLTDRFESEDVAAMVDTAVGLGRATQVPYRDDVGMRMEVDARRATVLLRAVALRPRGTRHGAVILIRDVTEVKRRDLALISKDATIREIHHRVKNNLQSVSALLRLQSRRTTNPEAKTALDEAVRRVASIALVHELLSGSVDEEVDLDEVTDRLVPILVDVAGESRVSVRRVDRLGVLPADQAMPLVMVLTELIQNAIEHGIGSGDDEANRTAHIEVRASRDVRELVIEVIDNGAGLPDGFDLSTSDRLGLQIVQTMVSIDLGGTLDMRRADTGGTEARVVVPLR